MLPYGVFFVRSPELLHARARAVHVEVLSATAVNTRHGTQLCCPLSLSCFFFSIGYMYKCTVVE